jgi:hypothetical protein
MSRSTSHVAAADSGSTCWLLPVQATAALAVFPPKTAVDKTPGVAVLREPADPPAAVHPNLPSRACRYAEAGCLRQSRPASSAQTNQPRLRGGIGRVRQAGGSDSEDA